MCVREREREGEEGDRREKEGDIDNLEKYRERDAGERERGKHAYWQQHSDAMIMLAYVFMR